MGCNCRGGVRSSSRAPLAPPVPPRSSLCVNLEAEGDKITVRVAPTGKLYLGVPFSSDLPAASLLPSTGCRGPYAQALLGAELKLAEIYLSPSRKARFVSSFPGDSIKLGFLREILRSF